MTRNLGTMPVWRDVLQQFARWQMLEIEARQAWLVEMQQQRPELYGRLQHMIQADSDALAEGSSDHTDPQLLAADLDSKRCGMPLGSWILQEPIARGGMGQVWLATRADNLYSGRAAVKLLNTLNASPDADVRFAREAEFLGRLAHPHIAQLFDAGLAPDGTRYLIMEYVEGAPLDETCKERQLDIEQRLELFLQVCAAVGYAHGQQIIHRDLKPANILVTSDAQVKLLDFGVAKLLDEDVGTSGLTRADCGWFTLDYAAPEQLVHAAVTTATDVYALGALLFNLLCGGNPHPNRTNLNEAIVHYAEPAISLRAGLQRSGAAAVAAQRRTTVAKLERLLQGELGAIVSKALALNPAERYDTAHALADDLRRYLRHEPLHARANHWGYRVRKFVQRNRLQTSAAAMVAASLLLGAIFATWQWRSAEQEAQRTRSAINMLTGTFSKLMPDRSPTSRVAVNDLFRQGWQEVQQATAGDARLRATVAQPLGAMLVDVGELAAGREALTTSRQYLLASGEADSEEYLQVVHKLAYAQFLLGDVAEAKARYNEVIQRADATGKPSKASISAHVWLGEIARREGQLQLAKDEVSRAVAAAKDHFGERSDIYRMAQEKLTKVNDTLGEWKASRANTADPSQESSNPETELQRRANDATRALSLGKYAKALTELQVLAPAMRERLGPTNMSTILTHAWLSAALLKEGHFGEAELAASQALQWSRQSSAADLQPNMEVAMARVLLLTNRWEQAAPLLRSAQERIATIPTMRPFGPRIRRMEGELLLRSKRAAEALEVLRVAHADLLEINGGPSTDTPYSLASQGVAMDIANGVAGAIPLYTESSRMARELLPDGHPDISKMQLLLEYARWRAAPSEAAAKAVRTTASAYVDGRTTRVDAPEVRALTHRLIGSTDAAAVRSNLIGVMDH